MAWPVHTQEWIHRSVRPVRRRAVRWLWSMPRVSVVIPCFNYARFVGGAVESVLDQTMPDLEVVVVDDGSTDETDRVVASYFERDHRVRYVRQENRGLAAARNTGVRATAGELVGFLDADDTWMSPKLERQVARFDGRPELGLVSTGYVVWGESTGAEATRRPARLRGWVLPRLAVENLVSGSATTSVVRRAVLDRVGLFDETLRACEDWDLWLRIARAAQFDVVDEPLARIRLHSSNMMRGTARMEAALTQVIDRLYRDPGLPAEVRPLEPRARAAASLALGKLAMRGGMRRLGARYLLRSIRYRPTWPDPYIALVRGLARRPHGV